MAQTTTIIGTFTTPGGQVVMAGKITAKLYPPGQISDGTKYAWREEAVVVSGAFDSFKLVSTPSLSHPLAYYLVRTMSTSPIETWDVLWRTPAGSYGSIDVNSLVVLTATPFI